MGRCFAITRNLRRCKNVGPWIFVCDKHKWQPLRGVLSLIVFIAMIVGLIAEGGNIYRWFFPAEDKYRGVLKPAKELEPASDCTDSLLPNAFKIFVGKNVIYFYGEGNLPILTIGEKELISMKLTSRGIFVAALVSSSDGRVIAEIKDNEFQINPNNVFRIERHTKHELLVYDEYGELVLAVRFVNPRVFHIKSGVFRAPGYPSVVIIEAPDTWQHGGIAFTYKDIIFVDLCAEGRGFYWDGEGVELRK